jgi:DNA invertase Pin-like site-specific DNA recombinase
MTTRYKPENQDEAIRRIRATRGQSTEIARVCGIERAAVYQWKKVPPRWIHQVAEVTGMSLEEIRPDIFRPKKGKRA